MGYRWLMALIVDLAVTGLGVHAADNVTYRQRQALDQALRLVDDGRVARMPITLCTALREGATPGAEAWTIGDHISVYTGSDSFRCATEGFYPCLMKLASVLIHEAWHVRWGLDERGAYDAQRRFLTMHDRPDLALGVLRARDTIVPRREPPRTVPGR